MSILRQVSAAAVVVMLSSPVVAYEPDKALRKSLSKTVKAELVAATPRAQRFSIRVSFSGKSAFRDYEKLAKAAGFAPYDDCSVATFVEVTNWQIITQRDVPPQRITELVQACEANEQTVLGAKPLSQDLGDREIMRGMWQRNLAFVGRSLRDAALLSFVDGDARQRFAQLHGEPSQWQLTADGFIPVLQSVASATAPVSGAAPTGTQRHSSNSGSNNTSTHGQGNSREMIGGASTHTQAAPSAQSGSAHGLAGANKVDQIVLKTVTRYGLSGVYVTNATYLLFKDGTIHRSFSENPYKLNVAASRRRDADDWGRWVQRGSQLQVTWPGDTPDLWKKWFRTRPAARGQTLRGRFQSADGFGGGRVANFNTVAFDANGRFSWASLKGGNTGGWLPAYSDRRRAGRYELDGYSIRLRFNDGTVEEYAFCLYPKDDEHFVIGSSHFVPLD